MYRRVAAAGSDGRQPRSRKEVKIKMNFYFLSLLYIYYIKNFLKSQKFYVMATSGLHTFLTH
jgi:hypothetical protein